MRREEERKYSREKKIYNIQKKRRYKIFESKHKEDDRDRDSDWDSEYCLFCTVFDTFCATDFKF